MTNINNPNDEAWGKAIANIEYVYQLSKALTGNPNPAIKAAARDTAKLQYSKICGKLNI